MSDRDIFANSAMQAVISNEELRECIVKKAEREGRNGNEEIAKACFGLADAMIKESKL